MERISKAELARRLNVTPSAVSRAIREGRVEAGPDGLVDAAGATAQWLANRRRRPRMPAPTAGPPDQAAPAAADYWSAKAERELAEARMATMREAEMRGELVRRVEIERELAAKIIALREHLQSMADRLAALVAAETDILACRRLIRAEVDQALIAFNRADAPAPEVFTKEIQA